jgi:sucrose-6-phosphate hydrolase SacC (GH32 family)
MFSVGSAATVVGRDRRIRMRVFLDKRVVEAYANDGSTAVFTTVDAGPNDVGVEAYAEGGVAQLDSFEAWPLKPARFSLDRYLV